MKVLLRELAHSRSGDKGNLVNVSVIVYKPEYYSLIKEQVTAAVVQRKYSKLLTGNVLRYEVDNIQALNFVLDGALGGGVSRNLCLDNYGKSLASAILTIEVDIGDRHP